MSRDYKIKYINIDIQKPNILEINTRKISLDNEKNI